MKKDYEGRPVDANAPLIAGGRLGSYNSPAWENYNVKRYMKKNKKIPIIKTAAGYRFEKPVTYYVVRYLQARYSLVYVPILKSKRLYRFGLTTRYPKGSGRPPVLHYATKYGCHSRPLMRLKKRYEAKEGNAHIERLYLNPDQVDWLEAELWELSILKGQIKEEKK